MNLEKYIGINFKENGSDFTGCDCWGLVRLFYKEELGIELPDFSSQYESIEDNKTISSMFFKGLVDWKKVDKPKFGDVMLYNIYSLPLHVGIYINNKQMLHVMKGINSVLERHTLVMWSSRLKGVYSYGKT